MVAGAEGAQLGTAALAGMPADGRRVRAGERAPFFRALQVLAGAVAALHREACPAHHHLIQLLGVEANGAALAHPAGDVLEQGIHQFLQVRPQFVRRDLADQDAHAAVNIIPGGARRDDAVRMSCGDHPTDGRAVALVNIGHGQGVAHNPRQGGGVDQLLDGAVAQGVL